MGLGNLQELHLGENALNYMLQTQGLKHLTVLDLSYNKWIAFLQLQGLRKLKVLNVGGTNLSHMPQDYNH
ncbi:unnamed protein product [Citrullus colocynthis]|uniref:Uncharacterized protein n=1 Tax=Citrullus colocynthis TaxID=252529 RepID=A0ABP0XQE3_9ROSI